MDLPDGAGAGGEAEGAAGSPSPSLSLSLSGSASGSGWGDAVSDERSAGRTSAGQATGAPTPTAAATTGDGSGRGPKGRTRTETRWSEVWENQRKYPPQGVYSATLLPTDRPSFSNRAGTGARNMDKLKPQPGWQWGSAWVVDSSKGANPEGWQFAIDFGKPYHPAAFMMAFVRRRRWVRAQVRIIDGEPENPGARHRVNSHSSLASIASAGTPSPRPATVGAVDRAVLLAREKARQPLPSVSSITSSEVADLLSRQSSASMSTASLPDRDWLANAKDVGAFLLSVYHHLLRGVRRSKRVKWVSDPEGSSLQLVSIACNAERFLCGIDRDGRCWFKVGPVGGVQVAEVDEVCVQSQRWWQALSKDGWSDSLHKADRPPWSTLEGVAKERGEFALPSSRWRWHDEWHTIVDATTDSAGWKYAVEFRKAFHTNQHFADAVRKRSWTRRRRVQQAPGRHWVQVGLPDNTQGACVAVGLHTVWVVTTTWQVFYRIGISPGCPEGHEWLSVATPNVSITYVGYGQIAVNSHDHVWMTAPDGLVYFRDGSCADNPLGSKWRSVRGTLLKAITLGAATVWGITPDNEVAFRQGVTAARPTGVSWVHISNPANAVPLLALATSPTIKHLWCVDEQGRAFSRTELSETEPTGLGWTSLNLTTTPTKLRDLTASGYEDMEFHRLPPLEPGPWGTRLLAQLLARDSAVEEEGKEHKYQPLYNRKPSVVQNKKGRLQVKHADQWQTYECHLNDGRQSWTCTSLRAGTRRGRRDRATAATIDLQLSDLTAVHGNVEVEDEAQLPFQFGLETSAQPVVLVAADSRKEKEEWVLSLLMAMSKAKRRARGRIEGLGLLPGPQALWGVDQEGLPWFTEMAVLEQTNHKILPWVRVEPARRHPTWGARTTSRLRSISAGRGGVVWGLGLDGRLHAYSAATRCWRLVPGYRRGDVVPEVQSVAVSVSAVWTVMGGQVVVRTGVSVENTTGQAWAALECASQFPFASVQVSSSLVTAVASGILVVRRGFSVQTPIGTHWTHHNGLLFLADWPDSGIPSKAGPGSRARILDIAGTSSALCALYSDGRLEFGSELDHGRFQWCGEELIDLVRVSSNCTGSVWGLTRDGEIVAFRPETEGGPHVWSPMISVNAKKSSQRLQWRSFSIGATGGHQRATEPDPLHTILGNGQVVPTLTTSPWAAGLLPKVQEAQDVVERHVSQMRRAQDWAEFVEVPNIRSYVCVWNSDGYWYQARLVGARQAPKECDCPNLCFFLARLMDQTTHIWLDRSKIAIDRPPEPHTLFEGVPILFSETSWDGGVRYSSGVIRQRDGNTQSYVVQAAEGEQSTVDISALRTPPSAAFV